MGGHGGSGSIPACAGEPESGISRRVSSGVYPRVCGGTRSHGRGPQWVAGLSPRVRGNLPGPHRAGERLGSIPACAGEPAPGRLPSRHPGVYPRVCGGTGAVVGTIRNGQGLSPRVRGNPRRAAAPGARPGSIPACAGEPDMARYPHDLSQVYPRVCGGTVILERRQHGRQGLSPRVRGNHEKVETVRAHPGSIPACAGEPSSDAEDS